MAARKKAEVKLFYASQVKYERALELVKSKEFKKVRAAYESLGGAFSQGHGYAPVEK